jgi:hypothetical protein
MKTIKKNWLKGLIISVSFLLINCSVEEEVISGSHFGPQNKKFTFQDFKKETKIKDFDIFSKYNVSRSENGVMQKSIQQDFITDTTSINRFEIPNTEKTTYSFKLYPLAEQLNSKEYYNMVVEKNGNQLTYMVFLNKDKQNPAPNELRTQTSQMVFNSRSPHSGFIEVITYSVHCNGSCIGVCDGFACPTGECIRETVSYLYIGQGGSSGGSSGSGSGGSGTGGNGSGGGGYGDSPLDGFYIPNPYDGMDMNDPSNSALALSFQINTFFNTLIPELKEIAKKYVNFAFAYQYFNINGFDDATKQHYLNALTNYKNFIDSFSNSQITTDGQAKLEYWAFQTFLNNNENGINNIKINNVKNFLNNPNVDFLTKEKIIDELATKNNQEVLDFVSELSQLSQSEPNQQDVDELVNITLLLETNNLDLYSDEFILKLDPYIDLDLNSFVANENITGIPPNSYNLPVGLTIFINYKKLRQINPEWSKAKCLWYASKEIVHLSLDAFGLIPVVGEVADLTNGLLYAVHGDNLNATLSVASAVPFVGWVSAGTKYGLKVVYTINTKVKLVWKVLPNGTIYFGSNSYCRTQLRKVLGLAVGNADQAHHIIPINLQTNRVVQQAAKSGNAFHLNEALNGIPLSTAVHSGSHGNYDAKIAALLNVLPSNATPTQCYNKVNEIINKVRTAIANNPNTPINQLNF